VHKAELDSEVDGLLDEIDDVLEVNAEEFVRSFVRKGGQGWTGLLLDPGFFQGAVAAGVAAIATWETFKLALTRTLKAFRHLEGPVAHMISADGTLDAGLEELVQAVGAISVTCHSARMQLIGRPRTAEPGTATRYCWPSAPVVTM
jgi:ubiquitin-like protein Pup